VLFRIVDIETAPDYRFWNPESKWRLLPTERARAAPGTAYAVSDFVALAPEQLFVPPQTQQVVAVAWCDVVMDPASLPKTYSFVSCESHADWAQSTNVDKMRDAERGLINRFRDVMIESPATLVTWNGRTFDLPVLSMRALHLGVPWGWYYDERDIRYRYSTTGHCDLMDFLSDYGACRSMKLDDAARLVGLPGKDIPREEHFDGSMVGELVAQGDVQGNKDRIARYCLQDVLQTALLFVRTRYHLEIIDVLGYSKSVGTFVGAPAVTGALPIDWSRVLLDAEMGP